MNTSFSAYQVDSKPEISNTRKHIRLKKSMRLPDDTMEYWGFFLPKGSTVRLSVCSRYAQSLRMVILFDKRASEQIPTTKSYYSSVAINIHLDNWITWVSSMS